MTPWAPLLGLGAGLLIGATSTGGGAVLTPALILLAGLPAGTVVGTDVVVSSLLKVLATALYARQGEVDWRVVFRLATGSIPGAAIGTVLLGRLDAQSLETPLRAAIALALLAAGLVAAIRLVRRASPPRTAPRGHVVWLLGLATGLLVGVTSIGSGSLLLPVLAALFPLAPRTVIGTDLAHALLLSLVASAGHALGGHVAPLLAAGILLGGIPGVVIGARLAHVLADRTLRAGLAILLVVLGVSLLAAPRHDPVVQQTAKGGAP